MKDKKKMSTKKKVFAIIGIVVGVLLLAVIAYLCYVLFSYSRIEDKLPLEIEGKGETDKAVLGKEYTVVTQNVAEIP